MNDLFSLKGKVAVVTGGYGYLGSRMVRVLSEFGAKVYVAGRSQEKFADSLQGVDNVHFVKMDVSDQASIKNAFKYIGEKEERINILVNNAYFGKTNHPEKMTAEEWKLGIEGAMDNSFMCMQASVPLMKEAGGKIINISSMYGVTVPDLDIYEGREEFLNPPNYGVAKAGVIHLTKYYAMYLAKYGINVNAISPGPFPNPEVQKDEEFGRRLKNKTLLKRVGEPKDLDGAIILLSSDASNYITGQNLIVDGGWTIK